MRSLRMMLNLMHDLERLSMSSLSSPFFEKPLHLQPRLPWASTQYVDRFQKSIENEPEKNDFQIAIDVKNFKPEELKVKVVDDCLVVEGKQEKRSEGNKYYTHHFVQRYTLPEDYDVQKVVSTLSPDGVLTVNVSQPPAIEHEINIQQIDEKKKKDGGTDVDEKKTESNAGSSGSSDP